MMLLRFLMVIDHAFLPDLLILGHDPTPKNFSNETRASLENVGLLVEFGIASTVEGTHGVTELGNFFIRYVIARDRIFESPQPTEGTSGQ